MAVPQRVEVVARDGGEIVTTIDTVDFSEKTFGLMMSDLCRGIDHEHQRIREVE